VAWGCLEAKCGLMPTKAHPLGFESESWP